MSDLLARLRETTPERGGPRRGEGLLVALSGGADSVALLLLLRDLAAERDLRLVAAHLDHRLRPGSAADTAFCADLCTRLGVEFEAAAAEVAAEAARTGEGVEASGRRLRGAWLEGLRARRGLDCIATGHQLDDHIETVLMWIGRGSGGRGLAGIRARRDGWIRPLRDFTRAEIREELRARGQGWREDPTNADPGQLRSRIRGELLPRLRAVFDPGLDQRVDAMSRRLDEEGRALTELVDALLRRLWLEGDPGRLRLDRAGLRELSQPVLFQVLRAAIERVQPRGAHQRWNEDRYQDVQWFVREATTGKRWPMPGGGWVEMARECVIFDGPPANDV